MQRKYLTHKTGNCVEWFSAGACSWSASADSPSRQRATVLFDTDDGGQIMVTYDAPPPATRQRHDNSTAPSLSCTPTTAIDQDERGAECQHPPVTETELQRQNDGDTQQVSVASSSVVTATSISESCEEEQATNTRSKNPQGSVSVPRRHDQKSATVTTQKEPRRSVSRITSTRRQSLGPLPSKKSSVSDQSVAGKVNGSVVERPATSTDVSGTNPSRAKAEIKKAETRFSSASRSVSTSRRSSLMKATASSLAKRCENGADGDEVKGGLEEAVTGSIAASLTSKITKLVKGGSKPAANKAAPAATSPRYNKRLSLDSSVRPRPGLIVGKTPVTSQPRDNKGGRKATSRPSELSESINVGQGHGVTSSTRGVGSGRGQLSRGSVQGPRIPPAGQTRSTSTLPLRSDVAKDALKKSVSLRFLPAAQRRSYCFQYVSVCVCLSVCQHGNS